MKQRKVPFLSDSKPGGEKCRSVPVRPWEIENDVLYTLFRGLARSGFDFGKWNVAIEDDALREVRRACLRNAFFVRLLYSR